MTSCVLSLFKVTYIMKCIILVVIFAVFQYGSCSIYDKAETFHEVYQDLKTQKGLRQRSENRMIATLEQICPGYSEDLLNATLVVFSCFGGYIENSDETACSLVKNNLKKCSQPLIDTFEECLPGRAKQVPTMVTDMLVGMFKYVCKINGEHLIELTNSCVTKININNLNCFKRVQAKSTKLFKANKSLSTEEICDGLNSSYVCFESHLRSSCRNAITREATLDALRVLKDVCNSYSENEIVPVI